MDNVERISNTRRLHSPGPWSVGVHAGQLEVRSAPTGRLVCVAFNPTDGEPPVETEANAIMLGAGPALRDDLAELVAVVAEMEQMAALSSHIRMVGLAPRLSLALEQATALLDALAAEVDAPGGAA